MKPAIRNILLSATVLGTAAGVTRAAPPDQATTRPAATAPSASTADLEQRMAELERAVAWFESRLPRERECDRVLKQIWQLADANGLSTASLKTQRVVRHAEYSEQPVELSMTGNFNGFYAFVLQLEKLPAPTRTPRITLTLLPDGEGAVRANMVVSLFFRPDDAAAPVVAGVEKYAGEGDVADESARIEALQAKQRTMAKRAELQASLMEKCPPSLVLAEVANGIPANVRLTEFTLRDGSIVTAGVAENDLLVAKYANKLSTSRVLRDVRVRESVANAKPAAAAAAAAVAGRPFRIEMKLNDPSQESAASVAAEEK